jgi:hypothetical protein
VVAATVLLDGGAALGALLRVGRDPGVDGRKLFFSSSLTKEANLAGVFVPWKPLNPGLVKLRASPEGV